MKDQGHRRIHREDYTAPAYWIDTVDLTFDLDPAKTRVLNRMRLRRNPDVPAQPLRLDGDELNLARVLVNGQGTSFSMEGEPAGAGQPARRRRALRAGDLHHLRARPRTPS